MISSTLTFDLLFHSVVASRKPRWVVHSFQVLVHRFHSLSTILSSLFALSQRLDKFILFQTPPPPDFPNKKLNAVLEVIMLFRNTGAFAALMLFSRGALAAPTLNATATDDVCEPDETITSTIHVSGSGSAPPTVSATGVAALGAQNPAGNGTHSVVTEVIYTTNVHTITSCAASITNCPASSSVVSTEVAAITTTYTVSASGLPPVSGGAGPSGLPSGLSLSAIPSGQLPSGGPSPSGVTAVGALGAANPSGPIPSGSGPIPSGPVPSNATAIGALGAQPSGSGMITGGPRPTALASGVPQGSGAGLAAANASQVQVVTETFYSTNIHTVLSCASSVTNCPYRNTSTTSTELIPTSTQVLTLTVPAGNAAVPTSAAGAASVAPSSAEEQTTLTVAVTQV